MVHYFLVDFNNDGAYYRVGLLTMLGKKDVESYWQGYSRDVRFLCTKEEPNVHSRGVRETPVGIICSCKFFCQKYEPFRQTRIFADVDSRMEVMDDETRQTYQ